MLPIILVAALVLIVVAKFCPHAPASSIILAALIDGPARWLERPRLSQAVPYALASVCVALLLFAAPEVGFIAATLDAQLMVDLTLAMSLAFAQVGYRRVRLLVRKAVRSLAAPIRATHRAVRIRRKPASRADGDDSEPVMGSAFA